MNKIDDSLKPYIRPQSSQPKLSYKTRGLLKTSQIANFMRKYDVDEEYIDQHYLKFKNWLDQLELCDGCRHPRDCRQKIRGAVLNLSVDENGVLEQNYESCKQIKKKDEKFSYRKNYIFSTLDHNDYSIKLKDVLSPSEKRRIMNVEYYSTASLLLNTFLEREQNPKGIFLYGPPGTGKTYLLISLANEYANAGYKTAFVSWPVFAQDYRVNLSDGEYIKKQMNLLKKADVLFIDDLGAEYSTAFSRDEILLPLLEYRMVHHKKTYFSSNFDIPNLKEVYNKEKDIHTTIAVDRLMDRIRSLSSDLPLRGKSLRY